MSFKVARTSNENSGFVYGRHRESLEKSQQNQDGNGCCQPFEPSYVHIMSGLRPPPVWNCVLLELKAQQKKSLKLKTISAAPGNSFKLAMNN